MANPSSAGFGSVHRRAFLQEGAGSVGMMALASLLQADGGESSMPSDSGVQRIGGLDALPHFAPKAKRIIYLLQNGGPTHVDLFDWKPAIQNAW